MRSADADRSCAAKYIETHTSLTLLQLTSPIRLHSVVQIVAKRRRIELIIKAVVYVARSWRRGAAAPDAAAAEAGYSELLLAHSLTSHPHPHSVPVHPPAVSAFLPPYSAVRLPGGTGSVRLQSGSAVRQHAQVLQLTPGFMLTQWQYVAAKHNSDYVLSDSSFSAFPLVTVTVTQWRSQDLVSGGAQPEYATFLYFSHLPSSLLLFTYSSAPLCPAIFLCHPYPPPNAARESGAAL